jgi:N-acetylglucosamine kinase-like BadF-type ATPase
LERHELAALLPCIVAALRQGDAVADELLTQAAHYLTLAARATAQQLDFGGQPFPVVLAGGTFVGCPELLARATAVLGLPHARPTPLTVEPAQGAVRLALRLLA